MNKTDLQHFRTALCATQIILKIPRDKGRGSLRHESDQLGRAGQKSTIKTVITKYVPGGAPDLGG